METGLDGMFNSDPMDFDDLPSYMMLHFLQQSIHIIFDESITSLHDFIGTFLRMGLI